MFAIAGAGAVIVWIMRKQMPESPRWLEAVGRTEEAEATLLAFEREAGAGRPLPPPAVVRSRPVVATPFNALFQPAMLGRTVTAALTAMTINVSVYGFVAWLPTFMVKQGMTVVQSLWFTTLMSCGSVAGALVGMAIGDRFSRRWSILCTCAAIAALGLLYPSLTDQLAITVAGFALVTAIYTLVTIGLYAYIPELFPTAYRLRGTGVASMCGRAGSITTPYLAVYLFEQFGIRGVLWMVMAMLGALCTAVLLLRVETAKLSLDDNGAVLAGDDALASVGAPVPQK
jgi:putative MFS transporter